MDVRKPLCKTNILARVNQFDIFNCYCIPFKKLNKFFTSELREDKKPTCSICKLGEKLIYRDFIDRKTKDCFKYIQEKYSVTFLQAMEMINRDFNLKLLSSIKLHSNYAVEPKITNFNLSEVEESVIDIRVCTRNWSEEDKQYWNGSYDVTLKTLKKFNIYPLSGFFINNTYTRCGNNVYGYYFGKFEDGREAWKIYQPFADRDLKWRSNCPESIIQGYRELPKYGDLVIITKALKDIAVLNEIDIPAIALQAESLALPIKLVQDLKSRFKTILLLYDNDEPGKNAAKKLVAEHGLTDIYMPECSKDASDFVENYDLEALNVYLSEIYELYSNNPPVGS